MKVVLALFCGLGLTAGACSRAPATEPPKGFSVEGDAVHLSEVLRPIRFQTEPALVGTPVAPPVIPGRVTTVDALTTRSFAPLNGRLIELRTRLGDRVAKGDKLVRVQTGELASIFREVNLANLAVETKKNLVRRLGQLHTLRAASDTELLLAESDLAEAKLRGKASNAALGSLAVAPADSTSYWILAPRAGTVVSLNAAPGSEVGPGTGEPIAVVSDLDSVLVVASLPPREVAGLALGTVAEVRIPGMEASLPGTIEAISEVVDPDTQTVPARIRVANAGRTLRPNGYVDVSFKTSAIAESLTVPTEAVVSDGSASVVFVEIRRGELEKRTVRLGRQGRERTEISEGLEPGEHVVTSGALLLLNALDVKG